MITIDITTLGDSLILDVRAFCPTGPGGGIDPTCSPGGKQRQVASGERKRPTEVDYNDEAAVRAAFEDTIAAAKFHKDVVYAAMDKLKVTEGAEARRELHDTISREKFNGNVAVFDAMTLRQVGNAVDKKGFVEARDSQIKSETEDFDVAHRLGVEMAAAGVHEDVSHRDLPGEVWRNSLYAEEGRELEKAKKRHPTLTDEHYAKAEQISDSRKSYEVGMYSDTHLAAYFGEPTPTDSGAGLGEVSQRVPGLVSRGGADHAVQRFMANAAVAVQMSPQALAKVASSGEFKNGFEQGATLGVGQRKKGGDKHAYFDQRRKREDELFGENFHDGDVANRPIYGYLEHPARLSSSGSLKSDNYGAVQVVFKPDVKSRTTYTVGDSLDDTLFGMSAAPVNDPMPNRGVPQRFVSRSDGVKITMNHAASLSSSEWRATAENSSRFKKPLIPQYIEAQIHGKPSLSEVAEVRVPRGAKMSAVTKKKLVSAGVSVVEVPPPPMHTYHRSFESLTWDTALEQS